MAAFTCLAPVLMLLQVTHGVLIYPVPPPLKHCCYGDETFEHGEVVLTLQRACLQLVCEDGKVVRKYLGEPTQRECCEFDGQLYAEGAELTSHCMTLECRDSCWHPLPTIAECCARCSIYDDPHFISFDGQRFEFHNTCNYSLAQQGFTREASMGVYGDFRSCFGRPSCVDRFTFVNDPHTVISLSNGAIFDVQVNGFPFHVTPDKVHALRSAEHCHPVLAWRSPWGTESPSCLTLFGSSRIILIHCPGRIDIIAHAAHTDELNGLCGHFNFHKDDDFTSRSGQVHPFFKWPVAFPNSWKTADQSDAECRAPCRGCNDETTTDPCTATPQERIRFNTLCKDKLGALLKLLPQLQHHIDDCAFDLCLITQYGREEQIQGWLEKVLDIVKHAIYLHHNTEGTDKTTTRTTTDSTTKHPPPTLHSH